MPNWNHQPDNAHSGTNVNSNEDEQWGQSPFGTSDSGHTTAGKRKRALTPFFYPSFCMSRTKTPFVQPKPSCTSYSPPVPARPLNSTLYFSSKRPCSR